MTRISRSITAVTPIILKAAIRDHCLVLEGRIDDENIYYDNSGSDGKHVCISPSKILDFPTSKNGIYADKFILDNGGKSFYDDIWKKLMDHMKANPIYRIAEGGPVEMSGLNRVLGAKDGAEDKRTAKTARVVIKKPPEWKLLHGVMQIENGALTGFNYSTVRAPNSIPACCISFELAKWMFDESAGITAVFQDVNDTIEEVAIDYKMLYNGIDVEDEMVYFNASLFAYFEVLL